MSPGAFSPWTLIAKTASLTDRSVAWPTWEQWSRILLLEDYNTRVVILATTILGMAAGFVGAFTLLRRRALMGDALSHATFPGIGIAYLVGPVFGWNGKSLPLLLLGAAISGILGMIAILVIRQTSRIREDAALGIVLSVFFGGGAAILSIASNTAGNAAGLESFIYGKTASIVANDAWLIGISGLIAIGMLGIVFKEMKLLCFDSSYAAARGFPTLAIDSLLMGAVVLVTIVGLQAVGIVLMIALLVIPAAAARFWTVQMERMVLVAGCLGALSCMVGAGLSGVFPNLPSGAMIVLMAALLFVISMLLGTARGVLIRVVRRRQLNRRIDRQHVLRGVYELLEKRNESTATGVSTSVRAVFVSQLQTMRSWSVRRLEQELKACEREGWLIRRRAENSIELTAVGEREAARLTHEHRLWELYLIQHADIAPGLVDRDADTIEHVLDPGMIEQLEGLLNQSRVQAGVVASPHELSESVPPTLTSSSKSES
jgi:manganese/zinc/iron transport system permease protein